MVFTISGLISRDSTCSTTSTVASSVTRWPWMKFAFKPGLFHRAGDGLAAAVHDHRVDLDGFEKDDVARHAVAHGRVGRIHETAAVFDDEGVRR